MAAALSRTIAEQGVEAQPKYVRAAAGTTRVNRRADVNGPLIDVWIR